MQVGAYSINVDIVVGAALACSGAIFAIYSRRFAIGDDRLRRMRRVLLISGAAAGILLSWAPWPIEHEHSLQPGVIVRMWGIPAPMAMTLKHGSVSSLGPALHFLALPLNVGFWAGVGQTVVYVYAKLCRRAPRLAGTK